MYLCQPSIDSLMVSRGSPVVGTLGIEGDKFSDLSTNKTHDPFDKRAKLQRGRTIYHSAVLPGLRINPYFTGIFHGLSWTMDGYQQLQPF